MLSATIAMRHCGAGGQIATQRKFARRIGGWAEVFQALENEPNRDWVGEYRNSAHYQQHVVGGMVARAEAGPAQARRLTRAARAAPRRPARAVRSSAKRACEGFAPAVCATASTVRRCCYGGINGPPML
jgi:hypothetical protein